MAKHQKKLNKSAVIVIALCVVLLLSTAGGVFAYLMSKPNKLSNEFVPASVSCKVEEQFENNVKSNVKIRNTGNINAYIRATVLVTFKSSDGKVLASSPIEGTDYEIEWSYGDWQKGNDGFWYYLTSVASNETTPNLINTAKEISSPEGYQLSIQIIASAIQAEPDNAVTEAWGKSVSNGKIVVD